MIDWHCGMGCVEQYDADEIDVRCSAHGIPMNSGSIAAPSEPPEPIEEGAAAEPVGAVTEPEPEPSAPPASVPAGTEVCWDCGSPSPVSTNTHCLDCHEPLVPPPLLLTFDHGGRLSVGLSERIVLGRSPESTGWSHLERFTNVSRIHAVIRVDRDGRSWIRDERSMNGTFVNDEEIHHPAERELAHGDRVRFGLHARSVVRVAGKRLPGG
ncbi:FHA domain-containing protein [Actinocorallia sp. B10E7]|uniref:FHA domain-containing protein n=1 Tax=Actinocorallia sp. B10E7 TaxID=3153558 RepID=UPI00325EDB11